LQALGASASFAKGDEQHAQGQQHAGNNNQPGWNSVGEGRPTEVLHQEASCQQPWPEFPTPFAGTDERDGRGEQNDSVRNFQSEAQGQHAGPQQHPRYGKACHNRAGDGERHQEIPLPDIYEDRACEKSDRCDKCGLRKCGNVTCGNSQGGCVRQCQAGTHEQSPARGPEQQVFFPQRGEHQQ